MTTPWTTTRSLEPDEWQALKVHAIFQCCKWDLNREDHSVLAPYALVLNRKQWATVAEIARRLTSESLSLEKELLARVKLHPQLGISRRIRAVLRDIGQNPDGRSARIMRFDFHYSSDGWRVSEVNSDVPGGFIESSGLTRYFAKHYPGLQPLGNPASEYAKAIAGLAGSGSRIALARIRATLWLKMASSKPRLDSKERTRCNMGFGEGVGLTTRAAQCESWRVDAQSRLVWNRWARSLGRIAPDADVGVCAVPKSVGGVWMPAVTNRLIL